MRNEDGHFILSQLGETIEDFVFGPRVQRCGWLVENQQLRIPQIGACESQLLPFAAGKVHAVRESATKHLIVMPRKLMHNLFCHALEGRGADTERIVPLLNPADGYVFRRGHFISHEVLKDDRDSPPEVVYVIVAQVIAVQKNLPEVTSYNRVSNLTIVVFPWPFAPTSAIRSPGSSRKLTFSRTCLDLPG